MRRKNINNKLFKEYFTISQSPSDMYQKILKTEGKKMSIKEAFTNVSKTRKFKVEEKEKYC